MRNTFSNALRVMAVLFVITLALILSLYVFDAISKDDLTMSLKKLVLVSLIALAATVVVTWLMGGPGATAPVKRKK